MVAWDSGAPVDAIEEIASGSTALRYDTASSQFVYNWKVPSTRSTCYAVTISSVDGSGKTAYVMTR